MKKTVVIAVPLVTILLFVGFASAKPIDYSENPNFHDVITTLVPALIDHKVDFTRPNHVEIVTPDSIDTVAPDDKKITDNLNSNKLSQLALRPIPAGNGGIKNVITTAKPAGLETPNRSTISSELGSERPGSLVTNSKPDSYTTDSSITSLEPVSEGEDAFSLATASSAPDSGEPDDLVTTSQPDNSGRRDNSATTLTPGSHQHGNKLANLPGKSEHRNGVSDIQSSCIMVLLGIFFIAGSQVA